MSVPLAPASDLLVDSHLAQLSWKYPIRSQSAGLSLQPVSESLSIK